MIDARKQSKDQVMRVVSKADAMRIKEAHPGSYRARFCSGKYKWFGSEKDYVGKDVNASRRILAVYVQKQSDKFGSYARMHCIVMP